MRDQFIQTLAFATALSVFLGSDLALAETKERAGANFSKKVAVAQFTTAVENRAPVDSIIFLENEAKKIIFFSDLRGLKGKSVIHRWQYQGEVMAEVSFDVGGDRWRVWSSKTLISNWAGKWTVSVIGPDGAELEVRSFRYNEKL